MKMRLLYLKFGVMDAQESSQMENAIHCEQPHVQQIQHEFLINDQLNVDVYAM